MKRALSLDALRGLAIIGMILSGQMNLSHLPAWMAHAQVPPNASFDPSIYGITWVDLVFPFFLFAMGASFPFSLGSKIEAGENKWNLCFKAFVRAIQLVFFALFLQHMKPFVISETVSTTSCFLSLGAFGLLFLMFAKVTLPWKSNDFLTKNGGTLVKIAAFIAATILLYSLEYTGKKTPTFDLYFSDIIIIVLANMAFFGSCIYLFTYKKPLARLLVLPVIMAVFLASSTQGWVKELYNYTPIPWAYSFYYLKYLFIVIPGSIVGELLLVWSKSTEETTTQKNNLIAITISILSLALLVGNVILLFTRQLDLNVALSFSMLVVGNLLLRKSNSNTLVFWKQLFAIGSYCLILGLLFEAYEGGIRKDQSTYSYYFVTTALACFTLILFSALCDYCKAIKSTQFLVLTGQNPMIAYVANVLVVSPILTLLTIREHFFIFGSSALMGFLQGVLLTTLSIVITIFFSKLKWFWRT